MLHTNLSTRPFYNSRAVHVVLTVLSLIVLGVTTFNLYEGVRLTFDERTKGAAAAKSEADAAGLRAKAGDIRARIDPKELSVVSAQAREANAIIDRRTFSWTELFAQVEEVLPQDVRITALHPEAGENGTFAISISVEGRRIEDVDAFVEALEARSTFLNVLPVEEQTSQEGLIEGVIEGIYVPGPRDVATTLTPSENQPRALPLVSREFTASIAKPAAGWPVSSGALRAAVGAGGGAQRD